MVPEHLLARFDDDDRFEAERIAFALYKAVEAAYAAVVVAYKGGSRNPEVTAVLAGAWHCKEAAYAAYLKTWMDTEERIGEAV